MQLVVIDSIEFFFDRNLERSLQNILRSLQDSAPKKKVILTTKTQQCEQLITMMKSILGNGFRAGVYKLEISVLEKDGVLGQFPFLGQTMIEHKNFANLICHPFFLRSIVLKWSSLEKNLARLSALHETQIRDYMIELELENEDQQKTQRSQLILMQLVYAMLTDSRFNVAGPIVTTHPELTNSLLEKKILIELRNGLYYPSHELYISWAAKKIIRSQFDSDVITRMNWGRFLQFPKVFSRYFYAWFRQNVAETIYYLSRANFEQMSIDVASKVIEMLNHILRAAPEGASSKRFPLQKIAVTNAKLFSSLSEKTKLQIGTILLGLWSNMSCIRDREIYQYIADLIILYPSTIDHDEFVSLLNQAKNDLKLPAPLLLLMPMPDPQIKTKEIHEAEKNSNKIERASYLLTSMVSAFKYSRNHSEHILYILYPQEIMDIMFELTFTGEERFDPRECITEIKTRYHFDYASPLQGPFYHLLLSHGKRILPKIIEFINRLCRAIVNEHRYKLQFRQRVPGSNDIIDHLNDDLVLHELPLALDVDNGEQITKRTITGSYFFWVLYRDLSGYHISDSTALTAAISALMAIEYWLFNIMDKASIPEDRKVQFVREILKTMLHNSENVATLSLVASLCVRHPRFFGDIALEIFSCGRQIFSWDIRRRLDEPKHPLRFPNPIPEYIIHAQFKELNTGLYRKNDLEALLRYLQTMGQYRNQVQRFIDNAKRQCPEIAEQKDVDKDWRLLLHRADLRNYRSNMEMATPDADLVTYIDINDQKHDRQIRPFRIESWARNVAKSGQLPNDWEKFAELARAESITYDEVVWISIAFLLGNVNDGISAPPQDYKLKCLKICRKKIVDPEKYTNHEVKRFTRVSEYLARAPFGLFNSQLAEGQKRLVVKYIVNTMASEWDEVRAWLVYFIAEDSNVSMKELFIFELLKLAKIERDLTAYKSILYMEPPKQQEEFVSDIHSQIETLCQKKRFTLIDQLTKEILQLYDRKERPNFTDALQNCVICHHDPYFKSCELVFYAGLIASRYLDESISAEILQSIVTEMLTLAVTSHDDRSKILRASIWRNRDAFLTNRIIIPQSIIARYLLHIVFTRNKNIEDFIMKIMQDFFKDNFFSEYFLNKFFVECYQQRPNLWYRFWEVWNAIAKRIAEELHGGGKLIDYRLDVFFIYDIPKDVGKEFFVGFTEFIKHVLDYFGDIPRSMYLLIDRIHFILIRAKHIDDETKQTFFIECMAKIKDHPEAMRKCMSPAFPNSFRYIVEPKHILLNLLNYAFGQYFTTPNKEIDSQRTARELLEILLAHYPLNTQCQELRNKLIEFERLREIPATSSHNSKKPIDDKPTDSDASPTHQPMINEQKHQEAPSKGLLRGGTTFQTGSKTDGVSKPIARKKQDIPTFIGSTRHEPVDHELSFSQKNQIIENCIRQALDLRQQISVILKQNPKSSKVADLRQQILNLELILSESIIQGLSNSAMIANEVNVTVDDELLSFELKPTRGNGWCTFYAAGISNPEECIEQLIGIVATNEILRQDLADTMFLNYMASLARRTTLRESFDIDEQISERIRHYYTEWYNADTEDKDIKYRELLYYLMSPEVCISYLQHVLDSRYAHIGVVRAYLNHIVRKQLCLIIDYGKNSYYVDNQNLGLETVYVHFRPGAMAMQAHYSALVNRSTPVATTESLLQLDDIEGNEAISPPHLRLAKKRPRDEESNPKPRKRQKTTTTDLIESDHQQVERLRADPDYPSPQQFVIGANPTVHYEERLSRISAPVSTPAMFASTRQTDHTGTQPTQDFNEEHDDIESVTGQKRPRPNGDNPDGEPPTKRQKLW